VKLIKAKAISYVKTDAEGRRHKETNRISYPSSSCRQWWMS